jgi:HD-GYP domain-containing protein (c-di-GMP phosphodiesterase class II)
VEKTLEFIVLEKGIRFDPDVVDALMRVLEN